MQKRTFDLKISEIDKIPFIYMKDTENTISKIIFSLGYNDTDISDIKITRFCNVLYNLLENNIEKLKKGNKKLIFWFMEENNDLILYINKCFIDQNHIMHFEGYHADSFNEQSLKKGYIQKPFNQLKYKIYPFHTNEPQFSQCYEFITKQIFEFFNKQIKKDTIYYMPYYINIIPETHEERMSFFQKTIEELE